MQKLLFVLLVLFLTLTSYAQQVPPFIQWHKVLGGGNTEEGRKILNTVDGGFLMAGQTSSNLGISTCTGGALQIWLVKLNDKGVIQWQRCMGGDFAEYLYDIKNTPDGGFIVAGSSASTNGSFASNHGGGDAYLAKLDKDGNIQWQQLYGGTNSEVALSVELTADGGYIFAGQALSNNGEVSGNHGQGDIWVVKVNSTGAIQWQKCYGGSGLEEGTAIKNTADGGYICVGSATSTDGQVTGSHGSTYPDVWIVKIDGAGNLIWQKCIGGTRDDRGRDVVQTPAGDYIVAAQFYSSDGNGPAVHGISMDVGIVKLSPDGSLQWQRAYGGTGWEDVFKLLPAPDGGYVIAGVSASNDGDVTAIHFTTGCTSCPSSDGWLFKIDATGDIQWRKLFGGSMNETFFDVRFTPDDQLIIAGYTSTYNDGDISGGNHPPPNNLGYSDCWVIKTGNYNVVKGTVYLDRNTNGIKDGGDTFISDGFVKSVKSGRTVLGAIINGHFFNQIDTGTTTTSYQTRPYYTVIPTSYQSSFSTYFNTDSISFALQPITGKRDYVITLVPFGPARPGMPFGYKIHYANIGTDTLVNKPVWFFKDSRLQFVSASLTPTSTNGDTLTWLFPQLLPLDTGTIWVNLQIPAPPAVNLGDVLLSKAAIDSAGDLVPYNNRASSYLSVVGAYDPNDKQEGSGGFLYKHEYDAGQYLTYTIRFQNTGTDTAFNIIVRDTLQNKLDAASLEMVKASHPYTLTIKDDIYCTWTFSNILLPDSNRNEPLSHGYITYRIRPTGGLNISDVIYNSASIYFDFNLPVKTNTQETVVKPTPVLPPSQPVVSGLQAGYCSSLPTQTGKITNLPLAASGITASVKLDATPLTIAADSTFSFAVNGLTAGAHTIEVLFSNSGGNKTATHNFTVTAAVTPDVNVTANITNVTNLTVPVIVTAVNAAGGGSTPLYTFAKDRNFTNVLQAEGTVSTLNIVASTLTVGDNWIHVRMKSNATCITTQTNTDSINIRRDQSTGIVDPENPNGMINIYPNPFKEQVVINGLNAQKKYVITITNIQGQQLYTRRIANRASIEIPPLKGPGGIYWLTLYDESRKRSIGSVKLIRQ